MSKIYCITVIISCFFIPRTLLAQTEQTQVLLGLVAFPPLSELSPNSSSCTGPAIDTLQQIFIAEDIQVSAICAPAARIYKLIEKGDVDLTVNVQSTEALKDHVSFFPIPYVTLTLILVTNDAVNNPYVASIRGFDYHGFRQRLSDNGLLFSDVPSANDAINLFVRQRTRHLVTYQRPYQAFFVNSGKMLNGNMNTQHLTRINTYVGVSNASVHKQIIFDVLDNYVREHAVTIFIEDPVVQPDVPVN